MDKWTVYFNILFGLMYRKVRRKGIKIKERCIEGVYEVMKEKVNQSLKKLKKEQGDRRR